MTMFGYAQSNSLLKREIEEKNDGDNDDTDASKRIDSLASGDVDAVAIPMNDPAKSATTIIRNKKTISVKKSQNTKHKVANAAITANANATAIEQQHEPEIQSGNHDAENNSDSNPSNAKDIENKPKKLRVRKPRRAVPNQKEYIPANEQPSQSDVVGGRGGRSNHHPGNRPYWIRILESRLEYVRSRSDHEKSRIAHGILSYVQDELNGRFLNIDSKTKRWYMLPNNVVLDKIKQALRDKYIPYWARELKIENKKHYTVDPALVAKNIAAGNFTQNLGMNNKAPHAAVNSLPLFGSSFGGMQNPQLVNQAVALAAMKASRANAANAFGLAGATTLNTGAQTGVTANTAVANNNNGNKLGFLFGASTRRPPGQTAAIPTVDDILKCKVDQMPSFGGVQNTGLMAAAMARVSAPRIPSIGMNPYQAPLPLQAPLPPTLMNSLGFRGLPGASALLSEAAHRGFGAGGNPGAPALPSTTYGMASNLSPSIGVLQGLNMKSLDQYMEQKMTAPSLGAAAFGSTAANLPSLNMMNALAGTSFDSSATHAPSPPVFPPAAQAPTNPKKTDWNAMYARALTNSK